MSILRHEQIGPELRDAYLKLAGERRRNGEEGEAADLDAEDIDGESADVGDVVISEEMFADLAAREQFLLGVTAKGFGVRSSAYGYRITGRGGQGLNNMNLG